MLSIQKTCAGRTAKALAFLFIVFGVSHEASAVTTYELPAPQAEVVVDFPNSGSGVGMTPNYDFGYRIPQGVTFDRIQMSVPSSQGTYPKSIYWAIFQNNGTWFYSCPNANCINDDSQLVQLTQTGHSQPTSGVLEWVFSTSTTITTSSSYFRFTLNPNPSYVDFAYNATQFSTAYAMNGANYSKSSQVPTIKFCNGTCDDNNFSPVPNLTASPWARLTSPQSGTILTAGDSVNLQFQVNTGTSTADNVQVRFSSNLQSLVPYDYTITQTGLNTFSYTLSLPAIDDYIQLVVDLRDATSSLYVSPTYAFPVSVSGGTGQTINPEEVASCDELSGLTWAICQTAVFLFVPSETSLDRFSTLSSDLETKAPFVYAYQLSDTFASLYDSPQLASSSISVDIMGGTLTLLSVSQLQAVPYTAWLRTILGYIMWALFAFLVYRRTLRIFNTNPQ